jgi:signal transduction histidine kinase
MRVRLLDLTAELRRRQAEAEAVQTGIVEGVFAVDRERRIRYLSPPMAALLGLAPAEAVGRFCGDVLRPFEPDGSRPCDSRCPILDARFRGRAIATESVAPQGAKPRTLVITSAAAASPEASAASSGSPLDPPLQFQVARDETEQEAGRRLRDLVVANISHEFRTPLSAQRASLELLAAHLRERLPGAEADEVVQLVGSIERAALRLTQLIDNLLESARIEAGRATIRKVRVAPDEIVEEATDLAAPLLAQRRQELSVELPYPLPDVDGDPPRLVQVFVNLLANANKFAPEGSVIRIGGAVGPSTISLWVEDEGPGLPAEGADALFGRFVRSTAAEPEEGGMGLGLWIVRSIVERHGGRVEARAGAGGTGTRVSVTLPAAAVREPSAAPGR